MTDEEFKLDGARPAPKVSDSGEFFADLIDHLSAELMALGLSQPKAIKRVNGIILRLSETFAGEYLYVSKKPQIFARQMAMYADLDYMPVYDVDKKYQVSRGYSSRVKAQILAKRQHRQQLRLQLGVQSISQSATGECND